MTGDDDTDALFDVSPRAMAVRYGELAVRRMAAGRDPYEAARLAGSFAEQVIALEARTGALLDWRVAR